MDLHCIHSPDIFFTGGSILCETPQKKRGLDDCVYVYMHVVCMYVYIYIYIYIYMSCIYVCVV